MVVFGTRPEAIKMAPVIKALEKDKRFKYQICVTGQHREMLHQVLETFAVKPGDTIPVPANKFHKVYNTDIEPLIFSAIFNGARYE